MASLAIFDPQRQWNPAQPFAEHPVNVFRPELITDLLQLLRFGTGRDRVPLFVRG